MCHNPWRGVADLPRGIWIIFAATLINRSGTMALPFLVLYLTKSLEIAAATAGTAITLYGLGSLASAPLAGWLCDRVGPLWVIQGSLVLSGALLTALPAADGYFVLLTLVFAWALIGEAYRPASAALISDLVPADQRKTAFAVYRLAVNLGMSVGPLAGGLLVTHLSYSWLFWADGATSILAGIVFSAARTLPCRETSGTGHATLATGEPNETAHAASPWTDPRVLYFMLAILPVGMVFFQFEGALPVYMVRELGLSESIYGAMFLVNTLLIIFVEVPLNLATSGWPHHRTLAIGALLTAVGFGSLALVTSVAGIAATIVVWTFGEMILSPGGAAHVADISPPRARGRYMAAFHVTFSISFALGPWLGVALLDRYGGTVAWTAALCAGCLSAAMLWRIPTAAALRPKEPSSA